MKKGSRSEFLLRSVLVILTLVVVSAFGWLLNWRFNIFLNPPEIVRSKDLGYRFNLANLQCENLKGEPGYSPDFLGPCGKLIGQDFKRIKIENQSFVGASFSKGSLDNFFVEWMIAPSSIWDEFKIANGRWGEADLRGSLFRNVVFEDVEMEGPRFIGAKFENCIFRNIKMRDVSFQYAQFSDSTFEKIDCSRCDFRNAVFENAKMSGHFNRTFFNESSILPFSTEDLGSLGFEYRK